VLRRAAEAVNLFATRSESGSVHSPAVIGGLIVVFAIPESAEKRNAPDPQEDLRCY